jgi:hypothetical protein
MARGESSSSSRTFMKIGFGRFRMKQVDGEPVTKDTPGAVKRLTPQNEETWAIEYPWLSGVINSIFYKEGGTSNDGKKFEDTYEVVLEDVMDMVQISFPCDSRYWFAFMKCLPNIILNKEIKISVYDYVSKEDKKRKAGLNVEQNDNPNTTKREYNNKVSYVVNSFFEKWEDKKCVFLHDYPSSEGLDWMNKDDRTEYLIKVKKFCKSYFKTMFGEKYQAEKIKNDTTQEPINSGEGKDPLEDDLPF